MKKGILLLILSVATSYLLAWVKLQPSSPYMDVTAWWGAFTVVYSLAAAVLMFIKGAN